jgi:hypothetical protein
MGTAPTDALVAEPPAGNGEPPALPTPRAAG